MRCKSCMCLICIWPVYGSYMYMASIWELYVYGQYMGPIWLQRSILQPTYMGLTRANYMGQWTSQIAIAVE